MLHGALEKVHLSSSGIGFVGGEFHSISKRCKWHQCHRLEIVLVFREGFVRYR